MMAHHLADLVPIHVWQEDIEQHEVWLGVGNPSERPQAIARRHDLNALAPQRHRDDLLHYPTVVHQEHTRRLHLPTLALHMRTCVLPCVTALKIWLEL